MGKSKFLTFILSAVPGLGHFYLGLMSRGLGIMAAFSILVGAAAIVGNLTRSDAHVVFLMLLPVIWFYGLFDALALCRRIKMGEELEDRSPLIDLTETLAQGEKSRFWALLFGLIPGAGHMYLGWREKGLQIMTVFFLSVFLIDSLRLTLFLFLLPIVWFFSFFDVLQLVSGSIDEPVNSENNALTWLVERQRWVGFGLIILGIIVIFDRLIVPYLGYELVSMLKTAFVAVLLIGGGLRLVMGSKIAMTDEETEIGEDFEIEEDLNTSGEGKNSCGSGE